VYFVLLVSLCSTSTELDGRTGPTCSRMRSDVSSDDAPDASMCTYVVGANATAAETIDVARILATPTVQVKDVSDWVVVTTLPSLSIHSRSVNVQSSA
jgi:hypothetical protein